jgi:PelA/Pel-15E family pectate lyase
MDFTSNDPGGHRQRLVPTPGAGSLWLRIHEIRTDKPIFGDRDRNIHYAIEAVSCERRDGYRCFEHEPAQVLRRLPAWRSEAP